MPEGASPWSNFNEAGLIEGGVTVLLPVPPTVRMAVEGKVKLNDGVFVFTAPLGGPKVPGKANPGGCTVELGLNVSLFGVALLGSVTGEGAVGIDALHGLKSGRGGAQFLE